MDEPKSCHAICVKTCDFINHIIATIITNKITTYEEDIMQDTKNFWDEQKKYWGREKIFWLFSQDFTQANAEKCQKNFYWCLSNATKFHESGHHTPKSLEWNKYASFWSNEACKQRHQVYLNNKV